MADCARKGRTTLPPQRGEDNGYAKLDEVRVCEIRKRYAAGGITQRELADEFDVAVMTINAVVLRKNWAHVPDDLI